MLRLLTLGSLLLAIAQPIAISPSVLPQRDRSALTTAPQAKQETIADVPLTCYNLIAHATRRRYD